MPEARRILIHEPDHLLRRTVVASARSLFAIDLSEGTRIESTSALLRSQSFDGLLLALPEGEEETLMQWLSDLRASALASPSHIAVIVMAYAPPPRVLERLETLQINRLLIKPLKVKDILQGLHQLGAPLMAPTGAD